MKLAVTKETFPGERRVSLIPASVAPLQKKGWAVTVQKGAGVEAGFPDSEYVAKGAAIVDSRDDAFAADVVLQVRSVGANPRAGLDDLPRMRTGQIIVGTCDPLGNAAAVALIAKTGATLFSLELIPRITRGQSMDVLSSQATIAGYRAVLLAASHLPKLFPLMMTAAGTLSPARVFIIGAGVAGLQAIATARRLGGVVHAYDVRPAVREQCESLGAKFVELQLESAESEDQGGYAKELGEDFYTRQRELMAAVVAESDVVITTAAIPGKQSPLLITADAVAGMRPGSVIIDLAAERGGNCEASKPDETVIDHGVMILGPTNLPSEIPNHASQMFSKNVETLLLHLFEGNLKFDRSDEITEGTLACMGGDVTHPRIRSILGLPELSKPDDPTSNETETAKPS